MGEDFGSVVSEVAVGMGPCGELRYPSYPEGDGRWRFPGVGEFQCYDQRALADLRAAAQRAGEMAWGLAGPHNAGRYNSRPHETGFYGGFDGNYASAYGHFFLEWYSGALVQHGERMLQAAHDAFSRPSANQTKPALSSGSGSPLLSSHATSTNSLKVSPKHLDLSRPETIILSPSLGPENSFSPSTTSARSLSATSSSASSACSSPAYPCLPVRLALKCAGIHWWYHSEAHAAELTAGYYNPRGRNGYAAIVDLCRRFGADLNFTCVEMRNIEQPPEAQCGPQELLNQVRVCAAQMGVPLYGENALARFDQEAYDQMALNACSTVIVLNEINTGAHIQRVEHRVPPMGAITFLRLSPVLFEERNFSRFRNFVRRLQEGARGYAQPWQRHAQSSPSMVKQRSVYG
eukprot:TRINITY_DN12408_c0_g3_i1.p1 TRINITY_DN12408_c0_g3~~TRINITY_DN12408_c0_g3_i1.p1  ORF type:complete len:458 (-),score=63.23 TRINITY_DN12408_c0_g3_i1:132-1346(-)